MKNKIRKNFNTSMIVALLVMVPMTFMFTFFRGATSITESWVAFINLCTSISVNFINYYVTHTGLGLLATLLVFIIGSLTGILFFLGQVRKSSILHKEFKKKSIKNEQVNGVNSHICIVKDERLFALTVGFFKPTIYISSGIKNKLSEDELGSVVAHEQFHQAHYHPLLLLFINTAQKTLFFFPFLKDVVKYINLKLEISADEAAIFITSRGQLASALVRIIENRDSSGYSITSTPGFSSSTERIAFISGDKKPLLKLSGRLVSLSIGTLFLINMFLAGPLSRDAHAQEVVVDNDVMTSIAISHCLNNNDIITWAPMSENQSKINMTIDILE